MTLRMSTHRHRSLFSALALTAVLAVTPAMAQTHITPPANKYSLADDVKLGQDAAAQARKELPLLNDSRVDDWVQRVGNRLAAAVPRELQHPEFHYTFQVVNQKEINAFALPGGPMFLNRGMIEAAKTEAEVAGVMAHEMSHVALRHGTAQATKGEKFQIGAIAGQILGAVVGGTAGSIISQGSQFGLGTYFLKYSREYESQADLLGAQIMSRAGYDPRQMANMFKTLEEQGGSNGPEFLSDHPNPGNRYNAIIKEASMLPSGGNVGDQAQFTQVKARLSGMSPALTAQQIAQQQQNDRTGGTVGTRGLVVNVPPPSSQYRTYTPAQFLRIAVPSNWSPRGNSQSGVTYAPEGGYFENSNGGTAFTHGVQLGVMQGGSGNLQRDTDSLLQNFAQGNPQLRRSSGYQRTNVGGRNGLTTQLSNVSEVTGQPEYVNISTAYLSDGNLLYMIGVAPQAEANAYANTFAKVRQNMRISDR